MPVVICALIQTSLNIPSAYSKNGHIKKAILYFCKIPCVITCIHVITHTCAWCQLDNDNYNLTSATIRN